MNNLTQESSAMLISAQLSFVVDDSTPNRPIHDALKAIRGIEIEAYSVEQGEHYADLIRRALETAGA